MNQKIISFHLDEDNHWAAGLACGHTQHVRHDPPFMMRLWVQTKEGRKSRIGQVLKCKKCDESVAKIEI